MLSNVQIVDEQQRALAFGDYARYWGNERKALLTRDPVVAGYDEGEQADTVFMRADSIFLYTVNRFAPPKDSLTAAADSSASDSLVRHRPGSGRNVSGRAREQLGRRSGSASGALDRACGKASGAERGGGFGRSFFGGRFDRIGHGRRLASVRSACRQRGAPVDGEGAQETGDGPSPL